MKLHILHTNDIHGHLEHWPVIHRHLTQRRQEIEANNDAVLVLDIGDAMDSVHPMVEASQGQIMVDVMNKANYDVVTIGNNEGLNFSQDQLSKRYQSANYQVVISNLYNQETNDVPIWAQSTIVKTIQGVKIGMIGLTAPYQTYVLNQYTILDPIKSLKKAIVDLQAQDVDMIFLLSHLGYPKDKIISEEFPEIQLIFGAHTHHVLFTGELKHQSLLVACGRYGEFVGEVEIDLNQALFASNFQAQVLTIERLAEKYSLDFSHDCYRDQGEKLLEKANIANHSRGYLALDLKGPHSFIQLALNAISWFSDCDLAFLNSGLFLSDLPRGRVNHRDLHEALPHPMHLAKISMTGEQLYEFLCEVDDQVDDLQYKLINGLGFRGKVFGEIIYKGINFVYHEQQWYVQGQALQFEKIYHLVTVDHLWFLPYFPSIDRYGHPQLIFPEFLRHVVGMYLENIDSED